MIEKLGFFAIEEQDIKLGRWMTIDEKLLPKDGEIWEFKLVPKNHHSFHYIKIVCVAYEADVHDKVVVFTRCNEIGLYVSLRTGEGKNEIIVHQPFFLDDFNFVNTYKRRDERL
jgi:hypothetical protein